MLKVGKLDNDVLQKNVIDKIHYKRPEVLTRAGVGEDCAVIDYGEYECVISTDPITATVNAIGSLAIHISCNDIASNGIEPLGITLAVLLPVGTTEQDIATIMNQAGRAAELAGVEIIGGHTEITSAVNQPVIVSTAIGKALKGTSQSATNIKLDDYILMTKKAGIEGTGIIVTDHEKELSEILSAEEIAIGKNMLNKISVTKEGIITGKIGTSGMHDVTEGGILGAIWEICQIADLGAEIWPARIPVDEVTEKICDYFEIDYLKLISSGSMLIIVNPEKEEEIEKALESANIEVTCIGEIREKDKGIFMAENGNKTPIVPPKADELYKVISK